MVYKVAGLPFQLTFYAYKNSSTIACNDVSGLNDVKLLGCDIPNICMIFINTIDLQNTENQTHFFRIVSCSSAKSLHN